ncbi:MAG: helix-turn-helix domain-containing protein [Rhodoglobus sp.]
MDADGLAGEAANVPAQPPEERQLDLESLKALSHPLRVSLLDALSTYGPFTASGLAERLGESSGATSYHLRQLERHGFVREVEGRGTGRERWWQRVPGGISVTAKGAGDSPAAKAATRSVVRQWDRSRAGLLTDFIERGENELSPEWLANTAVTTFNVRVTSGQLHEIVTAWETFAKSLDKYRGRDDPGSRPVQIHFNAFPVIDGEETPEIP